MLGIGLAEIMAAVRPCNKEKIVGIIRINGRADGGDTGVGNGRRRQPGMDVGVERAVNLRILIREHFFVLRQHILHGCAGLQFHPLVQAIVEYGRYNGKLAFLLPFLLYDGRENHGFMEIAAVYCDLFPKIGRLFIKVIKQADDYFFGRVIEVDFIGVGIEVDPSRR